MHLFLMPLFPFSAVFVSGLMLRQMPVIPMMGKMALMIAMPMNFHGLVMAVMTVMMGMLGAVFIPAKFVLGPVTDAGLPAFAFAFFSRGRRLMGKRGFHRGMGADGHDNLQAISGTRRQPKYRRKPREFKLAYYPDNILLQDGQKRPFLILELRAAVIAE